MRYPDSAPNTSTAIEYLNYLHPDPLAGLILPRGAAFTVHRGGPLGEDEAIDRESVDKWMAALQANFADGSKAWIVDHIARPIELQGKNRQASIEQVSLNAFGKITEFSNGKAEDTLGLKNSLFDFDNVADEEMPHFVEWLNDQNFPYSFAATSGSKGVHVVTCHEFPIQDREYAERISRGIATALLRAGASRWGFDTGPSVGERKYTSAVRLPGLERMKTGKAQGLLVPWAGYKSLKDIENWLSSRFPEWKTVKTWKELDQEKKKSKASRSGSFDAGSEEHATFDGYCDFFERALSVPRRDIFSGELMVMSEGRWQPAASRLPFLSSLAIDSKGRYRRSNLPDHLFRYTETLKPELLVEIPAWDGTDRIKEIAQAVVAKNCTHQQVEELIKEWGSIMFERVGNPKIQNRIILLKGPQGIGKDTLVDALVGGLGQFAVDLHIGRDEKDTMAALSDVMVVRISEFDRTARTEVSTLKDMITRSQTYVRKPYERAAKHRDVRCSFIATVNVDEILRDHTGNRRYIIFDIEKIIWGYPKDDSLQVLAQFRQLAEQRYRASDATQVAMKAFIDNLTPDDPKDAVLEDYDHRMAFMEQDNPQKRGEFKLTDISDMLKSLAQTHGLRLNALLTMLAANSRSRKKNTGRIYFRLKTPDVVERKIGLVTADDPHRITPVVTSNASIGQIK